MNFEQWWDKEGQFVRAGGGDYEKSFAYAAWQAVIEQKPVADTTPGIKDELTPRQRQVYDLILRGKSTKEISTALGMAPGSVKTHINLIFRRFDVRTRLQLIARETGAA